MLLEAEDPSTVVQSAALALGREAGYHDAAFVRPFDLLASIVEANPYAGRSDETTYRETFTFFEGGTPLALDLPWTNRSGVVEIFEITRGIALAITRRVGSGPGSPGAEIERLTGGAATTRTRQTIERLVAVGQTW